MTPRAPASEREAALLDFDLLREWAEEAQEGGYKYVSMIKPDVLLRLLALAAHPTPPPPLDALPPEVEQLRAAASQGVTRVEVDPALLLRAVNLIVDALSSPVATPSPDAGEPLPIDVERLAQAICWSREPLPHHGFVDDECRAEAGRLAAEYARLRAALLDEAPAGGGETEASKRAWTEALARPSFKAALDAGLADLAAGRTERWEDVKERLVDPEAPAGELG